MTAHTQPTLGDLMARFLAKSAPTGDPAADPEVEPHEVVGGFRASAKATWDEALAAFRLFGVEAENLPAPPEWAAFAGLDGHSVPLPLAAGLFPQRVRDVGALLNASGPPAAGGQVAGFSGLRGWLRTAVRSKSVTAQLLASGVAALLGDWAEADAALAVAEPQCVGPWRAVWENQKAAVAWLRGRPADAAWDAVPGIPAAFNRGVRALFAGKSADAAAPLETAAAGLPDASGWSHLARLYQSVGKARG